MRTFLRYFHTGSPDDEHRPGLYFYRHGHMFEAGLIVEVRIPFMQRDFKMDYELELWPSTPCAGWFRLTLFGSRWRMRLEGAHGIKAAIDKHPAPVRLDHQFTSDSDPEVVLRYDRATNTVVSSEG